MTRQLRGTPTPSPRSRPLPRLRALPLALLLLLVWLPAAAYIRTTTSSTDAAPVRWDLGETLLSLPNVAGGEVIYQINSAGSDNIGDTSEMSAVEAAFRHWEGIPRSKVAFARGADTALTEASSDGVNVVYWAEGSKTTVLGSKNFPVTGFVGLTVIVNDTTGPTTGLLRNADIILNGNEFTWTTDPAANPTSYDVEEIVTHEAGHVVGLDHSGVVGSTMYARASAGQVRWITLSADDVAGAAAIYPDQDAATAFGSQSGLVGNGLGGTYFGAIVTTVDPDGAVLSQSVAQPGGTYSTQGIAPGANACYVEAFDSTTLGATTLFDERDVGGIYDSTVSTNFNSTATTPVAITGGSNTVQNFSIGAAVPTINISAIGQRSDVAPASVVFSTRPTFLLQGDSHVYLGVSGPGISSSQVFEILAGGVTVNGIAATGSSNGEPAVVYDVSVDANAPLGLKSIRVTFSGRRTYATGGVEVLPAGTPITGGIPDLAAAAPPEVMGLITSVEPGGIRVSWPAVPGAGEYDLYRGDLATLKSTGYSHGALAGPNGSCGLSVNSTLLASDLSDGVPHYYLLAARNRYGEGNLGFDGAGGTRPGGAPTCP